MEEQPGAGPGPEADGAEAVDEVPLAVKEGSLEVEDREGLAALYQATGGEAWSENDNWMLDHTSPGRWSGVTSEHQDGRPPRAVALSLVSLGLVGAIPRDFATKCTHLQLLNLSSNALSDLPEEIALLASLRICNLSNNAFDGVVKTRVPLSPS